MKKKEPFAGGKSLLSLFGFMMKPAAKSSAQKAAPGQKRIKRPAVITPQETWIDNDGNQVKCRTSADNRVLTENGVYFSGILTKIDRTGAEIKIRYKDGHKIEKNTGSERQIYTENGSKLINKDSETISEMNVDNSVINSECKSMVYYDEDIKFARIDFSSGEKPNFAGLEIRQDGIVGGISQTGGKWHIYFAEGGQDLEYTPTDNDRLYRQVKNILSKFKENSMLLENTPVDEIETQIDGIYNNIAGTK